MCRLFLIALLSILPLPLTLGAASATVDGVEEDWVLVVTTPDPNITCPQISTQMLLDSDPTSAVMVFNLNYREAPTFFAGGLQVKIQSGDQVYATAYQGSAQLQTSNETIPWTQRLSLSNGTLSFKVNSGTSTTWGNFGQGETDLAVSIASSRTSLSNYSPDASVTNSGAGFGANRVGSMTLLRVRYYQGQTLLSTDSTPRMVNLSN